MKSKKQRKNIELYLKLATLINRQNADGAMLDIQGLYEAKKPFRCYPIDPRQTGFKVDKGEYFLLVDGKSYDTRACRLQRACRNKKELDFAWPYIGEPEKEEIYEDESFYDKSRKNNLSLLDDDEDEEKASADGVVEEDDDESGDESVPQLSENDYIKTVPVEIPEYENEVLPPELAGGNFLAVYGIKEEEECSMERIWGIYNYFEKDFANAPETLDVFKKMLVCKSAEQLKKLQGRQLLIDAIVQLVEKDYDDELPPHSSLVIGVIDGKNNHWQCGIWCYKSWEGKKMEVHEVDDFCPDGYEYEDERDALIPVFDI